MPIFRAEYPGVTSVYLSPHRTPRAKDHPPDRIVIHITDGTTATGAAAWFQNPASRVSAHYIIDRAGSPPGIIQCCPLDDIAWHAGNVHMNQRSIGIEHVAKSEPCTDPQYRASAHLIAWLCDRYGIPPDREHILGHNEVTRAHPGCPTQCWDWDTFWPHLTAAIAARKGASA